MTDKTQLVADGVAAFSDAETKIQAAIDAIGALHSITNRGLALAMTIPAQVSFLNARISSSIGDVSSALAIIKDVHNTCTKIAQAAGVDVVEPNSGGTRPTY